MEELAARYGVDRSYVGRTLRMASLEPSIVEAVLAGAEPEALSLGHLKRPFPIRWDQQVTKLRIAR